MIHLRILLLPAMLVAFPLAALADSWKDESGHGHGRSHDYREYKEEYRDGHCKVERKLEKNGEYEEERKCKGPRQGHYDQVHDRREYKEEYWDGHCKVERKLDKNGEYEEKRKCKGPRRGHHEQAPVYVPAPAPIIVEPGITIHGTVKIPQ